LPETLLNIFRKTLADEKVKIQKGFHLRGDNQKCRHYFFNTESAISTVVFVHATGNDSLFPQLALYLNLLRNGYNVFCFDLDGHGLESTTVLNKNHIWQSLDSAVETLKSSYNVDEFHLIGQSLGAAISLEYASRNYLKSLTLVSMPLSVSVNFQSFLGETSSLFNPAFIRHLFNYGLAEALPAIGTFKRDKYPVRLAEDTYNYIEYVKEIIESSDLISLSKLVSCPVLISTGSRDFIAKTEDAKRLFESIKQPTLIEVSETHFTTLFSKDTEAAILNHLSFST
jgi:pimeloyl-ACP methyl ester carboxylesterase